MVALMLRVVPGHITELEKKIEDMEANERQKKEAELQRPD